jgi:hypothetical protein
MRRLMGPRPGAQPLPELMLLMRQRPGVQRPMELRPGAQLQPEVHPMGLLVLMKQAGAEDARWLLLVHTADKGAANGADGADKAEAWCASAEAAAAGNAAEGEPKAGSAAASAASPNGADAEAEA